MNDDDGALGWALVAVLVALVISFGVGYSSGSVEVRCAVDEFAAWASVYPDREDPTTWGTEFVCMPLQDMAEYEANWR